MKIDFLKRTKEIISIQSVFNDFLENMLSTKTTADLVLTSSDGKEFLVHKEIMGMQSEYFNILLNSKFVELTMKEIPIDVSYPSLEAIIKYLYTMHKNPSLSLYKYTQEELKELMQVSNKFLLLIYESNIKISWIQAKL